MLLNLFLKKTKATCNASTNVTTIKNTVKNIFTSSSSSLLSPNNFNHHNHHYSSFKLIGNNTTTRSKFLFVVQKTKNCLFNNTKRSMSTTPVNLKLVERFDNIVKSSQDKRLYRGLLLDNQMKCLIISDPSTDRSAASVDVHAGCMLDPEQFPGLAHFCEHMLFMGSKKVFIF